jgi:hypothetical protein
VYLILFLAADVGSVCVAYWNVDGSSQQPKLLALVFGIFWSCWVLSSLWLIVAYFRERLFLSPDAITQHGCIRTNAISTRDVIQIKWSVLQGGIIVARSNFARIKIYLGNFTREEQNRVIAYFRENFSPDVQENWAHFTERRQQLKRNSTPQEARAVAGICALLLFLFAVIFGYCGWVGLGVQWLFVGIGCAFGGALYIWRIAKSKGKRNGHGDSALQGEAL